MVRLVNSGQSAHWERREFLRDPRDAAAEAFARPKVDWFCDQLGLGRTSSVLDAGAGAGMFTWWWSTRVGTVRGVELSDNMIRRSPCPDLMQLGDAYELPFADDSFDVAFAGNLLHHLDRPTDVLREMARVARRGIAVCEPNRNHPPMAAFGVVSNVCRGLLHYSRRTIVDMAEDAGLVVEALTLHGYVYENRSPRFSLPIARTLERTLPGGAYVLFTASVPSS